jgi:PKD repeat protein
MVRILPIGIVLAGLAVIATAATGAPPPDMAGVPDDKLPLFVNYGIGASPKQGDNDHHQAIYLSVPDTFKDALYLRIFDPDLGGKFDQIDGRRPNGTTRFSLFGGDAAFVPETAQPETLSAEELTAGQLLARKTYGEDRANDGTWQTVVSVEPSAGDHVGDRIIYRLVVEAPTGVDGNVFDVTLSAKGDDNVAPEGLRIFSYSPTVRMPKRGVLTELKFFVPEDATAVTLGNFDAANGSVFLTTKFVSYPLIASGQNKWEATTVSLGEAERGREAAVTLSGGREYPNDSTFYAADQNGKLIPFELPARIFTLNSRPSALATSDAMGTCTTVKFDGAQSSDPEGDPLTYLWRFGDGESEPGIGVTHEYRKDGRFTATLEVTDSSGQFGNGSAATVDVFVKKPPVPLSEKRLLVAAGEDVRFDGAPSTASLWKIAQHEWNFGDGTTLIGDNVLHAFVNPGAYLVTHTVVDDSGHPCNTAAEQFTVRVNAEPVARAGSDQRVSVGQEVVLDAGASTDSDGKLIDYQWTLGDGTKLTGPVVRHAYEKPATYDVQLKVSDDSAVANSASIDNLAVIVNDPPIPEAGADRTGAIGEVLGFDGGASRDRDGKIIAYAWDFGDGERGAGAAVAHAYARSGTYKVTLTVTDDSTTDSAVRSDSLSVRVNQPPVADAGRNQLVTASLVQFDGSGSSDADDKVAQYDWDFGDGTTGSGEKPTHVYAKPGTYDARLTVTDASATIRNTASDVTRVVVNAVPIADAGGDLVGAPGESLRFSGARSLDPDGSIAEYLWDFRDGASGSGKLVEHAFAKPGTYGVRLRVKDNTGQAEAVDYGETNVFINAPPVANAGPDIAAVAGDAIRLSAAGSYDTDGKIISYRWDFSDASEPVEGAEVTRIFKEPGVYTAQLTVTDDSGAANALATDSVRFLINHQPVADAGADQVTAQSTITFDGTKSVDADGDALSYAWVFGDGKTATGPVVMHTYAEGGTYPVVLVVDDGTRLKNAASRAAVSVRINRPPVAVAGKNEQVCTGDIVVLDGSKSSDPEGGNLKYAWTFGDGTASDIVNPTKSYSKGGTYPVTLTVKDDSGLPNAAAASEMAVRVDQGPVARAGADLRACAKTEVAFDGSASTDIDGVVNSFAWDFGDGGFGGGEKPSHIFQKPGTYRVFLRIEGEKAGICSASSSDEVVATIIEGPVAAISAPAAAPIGETVAFDGAGSTMANGKITAWRWDFGDGESAEGAKVAHRFASAGTYQVALRLKSDSSAPSCQVISARHLIRINAPPVAAAGDDKRVGLDEEAVFDGSASKDPDGAIVAYEWDFGDGSNAAGMQTTHRYRKPGSYTAKLVVRDEAGLANSAAGDEVAVVVNAAPAPIIAGPGAICIDEEAKWRADMPADGKKAGATTYTWAFGDGATAAAGEARHAYENPGRYSLAVVADDGKGLANSRQQATRSVHVNQPPRADAGPDQLVCPGDKVKFNGAASSDQDGRLTRYRWDFGDGTSSEGATTDHGFNKPGTYKVTLTVSDDSGSNCSVASDTLDVVVNAPPVPAAGKDREVFIGGANDAVLLDGSASSDPDGGALAYTWRIGDGEGETGERVRHTFTAAGDVPVTLTVADSSGLACGIASTTVHIVARQRD